MATGRVPTTANSPLTAKGDLFGYSTTQARVAVGSDGDTLVADSAATVGLRYQGNYAAGKNKILNANFDIWQRGTSFTTADVYTADRWIMSLSGATATASRQSFTIGQTDVPGNPTYFLRYAASVGDNNCRIVYRGEDVSTLSNVATTISFWAKGTNPGGGSLTLLFTQAFGSGGSSTVDTTVGTITLTASWQRFTYTFTPPSVSGKTIGAGNYFGFDFRQPNADTSAAAWTLDLANVQWEQGSVATAFQTATGTLQGELAACQRYYWRTTATTSATAAQGFGAAASTTSAGILVTYPTTMRSEPTSLDYSTLELGDSVNAASAVTSLTMDSSQTTERVAWLSAGVASGLTQYRPYSLRGANNSASYLGFSAEL